MYAIRCVWYHDKFGSDVSNNEPTKDPHKYWKTNRGYEAWCGSSTTTTYDDVNKAFQSCQIGHVILEKYYYTVEDY